MIKNELHIAKLLYRYLSNRLTKSEEASLISWRKETANNARLFEALCNKDSFMQKQEEYKKFEQQNRYAQIEKYISKSYRKRHYIRFMAAAAILLLVSSPLLFINDIVPDWQFSANMLEEIQPGKPFAILQTAEGHTIDLTKKDFEIINTAHSTRVSNKNNSLEYTPSPSTAEIQVQEYNTLHVPKGGEYRLLLSDGTKVWLNAESKLRYPVSFTSTSREVFLEGEAYFEVHKNAKSPFFVTVRDQLKIEVTGTAFNVRAYHDERCIKTVLEKGAVVVHSPTKKLSLSPNFLSNYDTHSKTLTTEQVNTELYTAWRQGEFIFENATVESILHSLSRWYDTDIIFEDENVRHVTFSGNVKKYETINTLLQALKTSKGIDFTIKKNKIYLRNP